ncbi:MAG: FtsX-like permease family protein [Thomasclavelia ramosa]|nr:FtsX-like permease family protein [Thomasclavelia ramosa]
MFGFMFEYFMKEKKKSLSLIGVVTASLVLLNMTLNMFYDTTLNPPLDMINSMSDFFITLFRLSIIFLFMVVCVYLIVYSTNYYNKVNSKILGILKIFGFSTTQIVVFFLTQVMIILAISFVLYTILSIILMPLLFKGIYWYLQQRYVFAHSMRTYFETIAFLFMVTLLMLFLEFRYIIQTPTTHLIKNDEIVSFHVNFKSKFVKLLYILMFMYGFYVILTGDLTINLVVPTGLCVFGINGIIKYVIPDVINKIIQRDNTCGEMMVVLKNYVMLIKQMKSLITLSILVNVTIFMFIYIYYDVKGLFVEFLTIFLFANILINYIVYQRMKIRRLDSKYTYQKLYALGYDTKMLAKNSKKEVLLFYITLFVSIGLYLLVFSLVAVVKHGIPVEYTTVGLVYVIPLIFSWIITNFNEGKSVRVWKK